MRFIHQRCTNIDLKWQIYIFTIDNLTSIPDSWYLCPCIITSPWKHAGPSELHLMHRIQQTRGDVTFKIKLEKLGLLTCSCSLCGPLFLLSLIRAALLEEILQQGTEGGVLLITNEGTKQLTEYILRNWTSDIHISWVVHRWVFIMLFLILASMTLNLRCYNIKIQKPSL